MPEDTDLGPKLTPLRIIVIAMVTGMLLFGAVALGLGPLIPQDAALAKILLLALGGVGAAELIGFLALRAVVTGAIRRKIATANRTPADSELFPGYATLTLVRSAMCEGFGLFAITVLLLTGNKAALLAAGLPLVLLVIGMPSLDAFRQFRDRVTNANPYSG